MMTINRMVEAGTMGGEGLDSAPELGEINRLVAGNESDPVRLVPGTTGYDLQ